LNFRKGLPVRFHHQIVEHYGPPSILVSRDHKVVHISQHAGRYFNFPVENQPPAHSRSFAKNCALNCSRLYTKPKPAMRPFGTRPIPLQIDGVDVAWRSTCERSMH